MKVTNKWNLPDSIVRAVTNDRYKGPKADSEKLSVTTLIGPPRIHYLKCAHWADIEEDVVDSIWKILGSAAHAVMERAENKQSITEERLEKTIDGITISGAFDLYDSETQELHDYKTTSAFSIVFNPEGKPEWITQLNLYGYLLSEIGFPVKALKIIAILRDHSAAKVVEGGNYPPIPIHIINIPLWDKAKTELYIKERITLFKSCKGIAEDKLPFCSDEEVWAKETTYAIMKPGGKRAVKVCQTWEEAQSNCPVGCSVVVRPGEHTRCGQYCQVSRWCNQYTEYKIGGGQ